MDLELENKINEIIEQLKLLSIPDIDFEQMDPVAKMMLVALVNETQKIRDHVESFNQRITDRYCTDFIPREKVEAIPAITLLCPSFKTKKDPEPVSIGSGAVFNYIREEDKKKTGMTFIPIFNTMAIPYSECIICTQNRMRWFNGEIKKISRRENNKLWVGINTKAEPDSFQGLPMLIKGTRGVLPEHIFVGNGDRELDFVCMRRLEDISMATPFDAQQASEQMFSFVELWKKGMLNMEDASLIVITDPHVSRDTFKPTPFPRVFQQWLEDEYLKEFDNHGTNSIWLQLVFPEGYTVPDNCDVIPNIFPVANIDVCNLTLTQSSPIAKLQSKDNSFFLRVLETNATLQKQGFSTSESEFVIRDFDANCYHEGDLYRDVRNLYNHFLDDYQAFITYNNIKDGETLTVLRETINKISKSVGNTNPKYKFDSGVYAMKNLKQYPPTSITKVHYITTQGKAGNSPKAGDYMENKKIPALELRNKVMCDAFCGADKASADERYELLRYYALTNDRLFSKMDIEAFLRKEIMVQFGKDEFKRIFIKMSVEGHGGDTRLERGLYIDIEFKDKKNYEKAQAASFDKLLSQKIENRSCISMPIIIRFTNLEG